MNKFMEFEGGKIHYRDEGNGNTLVLIHGFLENLNMWTPFVPVLQNSFRIITIDLPGHGLSSNYGTNNSMEFMASAVKQLLDLLYVDKAVIIGHSMGGYVTVAFARNYPDMVAGFGFFHSHASADTAEGKINRGRAIKVVEKNHRDFISAFIPDLFTPENRKTLKSEIENLQKEARMMEKEGVIAALNGMRERTDGYSLLKSATVPVMFIIGKQDIRAPMNELKEQIFMPAQSHVLILEKTAHMGFLEAFDETAAFLKSFTENCFK